MRMERHTAHGSESSSSANELVAPLSFTGLAVVDLLVAVGTEAGRRGSRVSEVLMHRLLLVGKVSLTNPF